MSQLQRHIDGRLGVGGHAHVFDSFGAKVGIRGGYLVNSRLQLTEEIDAAGIGGRLADNSRLDVNRFDASRGDKALLWGPDVSRKGTLDHLPLRAAQGDDN